MQRVIIEPRSDKLKSMEYTTIHWKSEVAYTLFHVGISEFGDLSLFSGLNWYKDVKIQGVYIKQYIDI